MCRYDPDQKCEEFGAVSTELLHYIMNQGIIN